MAHKLKVWYGVDRLNKVMKKPSVSIVFENSIHLHEEILEKKVRQRMDVAYMRYQTDEESLGAEDATRIFQTWTMEIYGKAYKGDIEYLLNQNSLADENNVSLEEREVIKQKLRELLKKRYPDLFNGQENVQLKLPF